MEGLSSYFSDASKKAAFEELSSSSIVLVQSYLVSCFDNLQVFTIADSKKVVKSACLVHPLLKFSESKSLELLFLSCLPIGDKRKFFDLLSHAKNFASKSSYPFVGFLSFSENNEYGPFKRIPEFDCKLLSFSFPSNLKQSNVEKNGFELRELSKNEISSFHDLCDSNFSPEFSRVFSKLFFGRLFGCEHARFVGAFEGEKLVCCGVFAYHEQSCFALCLPHLSSSKSEVACEAVFINEALWAKSQGVEKMFASPDLVKVLPSVGKIIKPSKIKLYFYGIVFDKIGFWFWKAFSRFFSW